MILNFFLTYQSFLNLARHSIEQLQNPTMGDPINESRTTEPQP